jgi:hypothetical protein
VRRLAVIAVVVAGCGRTAPYEVAAANAKMQQQQQQMPMPPACITSTDNPTIAWERWRSPSVVCFGMTFDGHGVDGEYAFEMIPAPDDPGWEPELSPNISFNQMSRLCDPSVPCGCSAGGDFTYFQTSLELQVKPSRVEVDIQNVDDGVEIRLFNAKHPDGMVVGHAYFPGGTSADFGDEVIVGANRIVLTHIDDCCKDSRIDNALLWVDGASITHCK